MDSAFQPKEKRIAMKPTDQQKDGTQAAYPRCKQDFHATLQLALVFFVLL